MSVIRPISLILFSMSSVACVAQAGPNAIFTVPQKTVVPGKTLQTGAYTIQVVDHLSDRSVVQIISPGKPAVTFLGVSATLPASASGPVFWTQQLHGQAALRGFSFPTGERLEFVYPKDEAVALATSNKEGVVAVDPASEKRPELAKLSPEDLQLVTLWSLTPVKVGPQSAGTAGIEAKRFTATDPTVAAASTTSSTPVSSASVAAGRNTAPQPPSRTAPQPPSGTAPQPTVVAKLERPQLGAEPNHTRSYVKRLPKTAGYTPLLALVALLSIVGAASLRLRRSM